MANETNNPNTKSSGLSDAAIRDLADSLVRGTGEDGLTEPALKPVGQENSIPVGAVVGNVALQAQVPDMTSSAEQAPRDRQPSFDDHANQALQVVRPDSGRPDQPFDPGVEAAVQDALAVADQARPPEQLADVIPFPGRQDQ
ncbi:hypothetical protein CR970_03750 [Candidatus Saccharibacteria bacterium]|nr:MAG: hypothetical protein CR970_03750 [Candidatus Saccharibacteria bacterium]